MSRAEELFPSSSVWVAGARHDRSIEGWCRMLRVDAIVDDERISSARAAVLIFGLAGLAWALIALLYWLIF